MERPCCATCMLLLLYIYVPQARPPNTKNYQVLPVSNQKRPFDIANNKTPLYPGYLEIEAIANTKAPFGISTVYIHTFI